VKLNIIQINNLSKIYQGDFKAIKNLTLEIKEGEIFGLVGPNGAGKTTLLKILKGVLTQSLGSFSINNHLIEPNKDTTKIKSFTGYLSESPPQFKTLTAQEYLYMVGILYKVPDTKIESRIKHLVHFFDLEEWIHTPLKIFSEGMLQRIHWAATLIHNPPIILLDDPLRALDVHSFQLILNLMDQLKKIGKTIIVASHYLSLVEKVCDRIAVLSQGRLITSGTIQEILKKSTKDDLTEAYLSFFPTGLPDGDIGNLVVE